MTSDDTARTRGPRPGSSATPHHDQAAHSCPRSSAEDRLTGLLDAAADLVAPADPDAVLVRLAARAARVVPAATCLVVVGQDGHRPPAVHSPLPADDRVRALAAAVVAGEDLGPTATLVTVASGGHPHATLVVVGAGAPPTEEERSLLLAHTRHAAVLLDLHDAEEEGRRESARARALLDLARQLAGAPDVGTVARHAAAAVTQVAGSPGGALMLWDPSVGALLPAACAGLTPELEAAFLATRLRAEDIPELVTVLTRHGAVVLDHSTVSPALAAVMADLDAVAVIAVPLLAGDTLAGVVTGSWAAPVRGDVLAEALVRMEGVGDLTATALQNVRLLRTVRHQALHDALTGLPNRVLFTRGLDDALRGVGAGRSTAVLFCDVDRFKHVNERLGQAGGDELLRQVAARLRGELRPQDVVGRLSGDEFAVHLEADEQSAVTVARRIVDALDQPFRIDGREVRITVSVGVAVHEGLDGRGERLIAAADAAMHVARGRGRNQVAVSGETTAGQVVPSMEAELSRAARADQLRLYYQPVMDLRATTPAVVGAEALLRWAHPRLGLLGPAAFLPLAEEAGLVSALDLWAVRAACMSLAGWQRTDGELRVAVNLASATLLDPRLLPTVRTALTENGVRGDQLHLELVESRSLADLPGVIERLVELRRIGVRISLDDFGTGFSTLTWLQQLPIDQIKIDRSFTMRLPGDGASVAVVRGVMALARELGIEVIAEGVEEPDQLAMLRDLGCTMAQGYLLGRPTPVLARSVDAV